MWAKRALLIAVSACLIAFPASAAAADFTWSGEGTSAASGWSNDANWAGGAPPSGSVGALSFPLLSGCDASVNACYASNNDLAGISADSLSVDGAAPYVIGGNGITITGGIDETTAATSSQGSPSLTLPITLAADQTWTIDAGNGGVGALTVGTVTGSSHALTIEFDPENAGTLNLSSDVEVGSVTVNGMGTAGVYSSLNATDGNTISVDNLATLSAPVTGVSAGPLAVGLGMIEVGRGATPDGTLAVTGAINLSSSSFLKLHIDRAGTTPATDFSQLTATGPVDLGNSRLLIYGPLSSACPQLDAGDVYTLISTPGSISGKFSGVPDGGTAMLQCIGGDPAPTVRINYTTHAVTATVLDSTSTGLAASSTHPTVGQSVTYRATVTRSHAGGGTPTGLVTFADGGTSIGGCSSQPLDSSGVATCTTSYAAAGTHTITASYAGSGNEAASTSSPLTVTVTAASPPPVITAARVSPKRISTAGRKVKGKCVKPTAKNEDHKPCKRSIKLTFSYSLSAPGKVELTVSGKRKGHKVWSGSIVTPGKAGANTFRWNGKLGSGRLGAGTYTVILTPIGSGGTGSPQKVTFRITR